MGAESAILASLVTAGSGLLGVVLARCKCMYKRDAGGNGAPIVAFSDKAITPDEHEIEIFRERVGDDIPVLIITKKAGLGAGLSGSASR